MNELEPLLNGDLKCFAKEKTKLIVSLVEQNLNVHRTQHHELMAPLLSAMQILDNSLYDGIILQ